MPEKRRQATSELEPLTEPPGPLCEHGAPDDAEGVILTPSYTCILGGAKVSVPLWHAVRDSLGVESPSIGYGATEASPGVTHLRPGLAPHEEGEIGHPLPGVSLRLFPGKGLEFTGPGVCLAILQAGRIKFPEKILLCDEVRAREDGVLIYEGRCDLTLNRGGQKFSLERIEEAIRGEMQLEAICVPVPDERLGEELGILVHSLERGESPQERRSKVYSLLERRFGQSFDPRRFLEVADVPLNGSAKVDRKRVAQLLSGT